MEKEKISLPDMLNHSKQELVQADSKLGWLLTVHVLLVTTLMAIGGTINGVWLIVSLVTIIPAVSIMIILHGLLPRDIPYGEQGLNPFNYKTNKASDTQVDTDYNTTISVNLFLARKKYICARNSFWYVSVPKWLFIKIQSGFHKKQ